MAGNRRHPGGINSAMANLTKLDEEIAARQEAGAPVARLTKTQALERYVALRDSALGFAPREQRARRLACIASPEEIKAFSRATEHLAWPESFGQTPWECASVIGWGLRFEEEHPGQNHWARETVAAYRHERHEVDALRAAARPPTLYIYRTDSGESAGQVIGSDGKALSGIGGCRDENEVITAATDQGYERLGLARVARLEDIPGFARRPVEPECSLQRAGRVSNSRNRAKSQGRER